MNPNEQTYAIIHHRADLDGIGSYHVIADFLLEKGVPAANITPIPWDYGDEYPTNEFVTGHNVVYMVDISFPPEKMLHYKLKLESNFIWIDHHTTALAAAVDGGYDDLAGLRSEGRPSAVQLCWQFCYPTETVPDGIKLLSAYDTWDKDGSTGFDWVIHVTPHQVATKTKFLKTIDVCDANETRHFMANIQHNTGDAINRGRDILKYVEMNYASHAKRAFSFRFKELTFAVINQGECNSEIAKTIPFMYDAIMLFKYDGVSHKWKFSLYGKDGETHDLSAIAKELGGGGHKYACGFETADLKTVFGDHIGV
jgi:oligoribonuclease NrnB/cAMP/cGMP phosphodiesterase (DHH superfamily)